MCGAPHNFQGRNESATACVCLHSLSSLGLLVRAWPSPWDTHFCAPPACPDNSGYDELYLGGRWSWV